MDIKVFHADGNRSWENQGRREIEMISKGQSQRKDWHSTLLPCWSGAELCKLTMPGGTFWSLSDSPEHQHEFPHPAGQLALPKLAKIKPRFSNIFARTADSALKNYFPSYPPWRNSNDVGKSPGLWSWKRKAQKGKGAGSSYCKGEASVLGDVPVPGEHGGPAASPGGHARPPEVPFLLWGSKSIRHIILCKLLEHLQGRGRGCCAWLLPPAGWGSQEGGKDMGAGSCLYLAGCELEAWLEQVDTLVHRGNADTASFGSSHLDVHNITRPGLVGRERHGNLGREIPSNPAIIPKIREQWDTSPSCPVPGSQRRSWQRTAGCLWPPLRSPWRRTRAADPGEPWSAGPRTSGRSHTPQPLLQACWEVLKQELQRENSFIYPCHSLPAPSLCWQAQNSPFRTCIIPFFLLHTLSSETFSSSLWKVISTHNLTSSMEKVGREGLVFFSRQEIKKHTVKLSSCWKQTENIIWRVLMREKE